MVQESFTERGAFGHEECIGVCVWWTGYRKGNSTSGLGGGRNPLSLGSLEGLNIVGLDRKKGGR